MNKVLGIGIATAATLGAAGYYTGPDANEPGDIPPLLVDGAPEQVLAKVRGMTLSQFLQHRGASPDAMNVLRSSTSLKGNDEVLITLSHQSDHILVLRAKARSVDEGKTELDISAELPESRFRGQSALHPYDLKVIKLFADYAATDYISSRLTGQRMATGSEFSETIKDRTGFDSQELLTFQSRLNAAYTGAYYPARDSASYNRSYDDWNTQAAAQEAAADQQESSRSEREGQRIASQQRAAAQRAAYEARNAAREAEQAARRASYEAERSRQRAAQEARRALADVQRHNRRY